jgi:hypothetical protein
VLLRDLRGLMLILNDFFHHEGHEVHKVLTKFILFFFVFFVTFVVLYRPCAGTKAIFGLEF